MEARRLAKMEADLKTAMDTIAAMKAAADAVPKCPNCNARIEAASWPGGEKGRRPYLIPCCWLGGCPAQLCYHCMGPHMKSVHGVGTG